MTKSRVDRRVLEERRCRWCRRAIPARSGPGRPREFCSQRCRQWDWVARQRARELQLAEDEIVLARTALDALRDDLYVLTCALEDAERDLAAAGSTPSARELQEILDWVLDAARPLRNRELSSERP
jgi:endogenous inhibitor of DNA gyrase (YacG/DUF329 family)